MDGDGGHLRGIVLVAEHEREHDTQRERVTRERQPDTVPVTRTVHGVVIDHGARNIVPKNAPARSS